MIEEKVINKYFINKKLDMENLIEDYQNYIRTIIKNFQNINLEDEEEIVSDVFFIIWKNQNRLEKNSKLSPYLARITKNIIYQKFKKRNINIIDNELNENEVNSEFNVEKLLEEKELNDCIINNVKRIGEFEYQVFIKFYYEDKAVRTIAKELEVSVSNVKTTLHRTRKKVKEFLKVGGLY